MITFTPRLERAIRVATIAHEPQRRKGSDTPYITHPYSVMCVASAVTDDEDVLIACLFHDVIEDVPERYPRVQMVAEFGERVASIVDGVTKDDSIKDWKARADAYLDHLEHTASDESVIVSLSDKIHNLMSVLEDYKIDGEKLWKRFNSNKDQQKWWYGEILRIGRTRLPDCALNEQLAAEVEQFAKI